EDARDHRHNPTVLVQVMHPPTGMRHDDAPAQGPSCTTTSMTSEATKVRAPARSAPRKADPPVADCGVCGAMLPKMLSPLALLDLSQALTSFSIVPTSFSTPLKILICCTRKLRGGVCRLGYVCSPPVARKRRVPLAETHESIIS